MECLETEHGPHALVNPPVILRYPVVEIFAVADLDTGGRFLDWPPKSVCRVTDFDDFMVGLATINHDACGTAMVRHGYGHEALSGW